MHETVIERVLRDGETFFRIDPLTVDLTKMDQALKLTNVFAFQVSEGPVNVTTVSDGVNETINYAHPGDWIVYNIGTGSGTTLKELLATSDLKVIREEDFPKLYSKPAEEDGSDYSDYEPFFLGARGKNVAVYHYTGKPVFVARVPFNFVLKAPWGQDQYIRSGGLVVYNPNTSAPPHRLDIYGTQGARERRPGQFEKTHAKIDGNTIQGDARGGAREKIDEAYKRVIAADRSPIAGIQFNMPDLKRAYDRIGKEIAHQHHKQ